MDEHIASPAPEEKKPTAKERLKEITDNIEAGIQTLFESDRFKEYLRVMGKFHNYSFNNTMLIHMQRPDATHVAGFTKWKEQFNRDVKGGEHGIKIIAPAFYKKKVEEMKVDPETNAPMVDLNGEVIMEEKEVKIPTFKVVTVFDVSQTVGDPLPQLAAELTGDVQQYDIFMEALKRSSPVPMELKPLESNLDGYFSQKEQSIAIREGMSEVQTVCAAVHEISHAKLHNKLAQADIKYQRGELFGRTVLFTKSKIDKDKLPIGLHGYDLRSMPDDRNTPALLENKVLSNFAGTIITDMSLTMSEKGYISIKDELSVTDTQVTLQEYYSEVQPEMANKNSRTQEVEAESIAYAVCAYYGIETGDNSLGYIASWSSDKTLKELRASLETINITASGLISDIDKNFALICKERGIDRAAEAEPHSHEALFLLDDSVYLHIQRHSEDMGYDYTLYSADSLKQMDGGVLVLADDSPLTDAPLITVADTIITDYGVTYTHMNPADLNKLHEIEQVNKVVPPMAAVVHDEDAPVPTVSLDAYPMPHETLGMDVFTSLGYMENDTLPVSREQAHELLDKDFSVFFIGASAEPTLCIDHEDINNVGLMSDPCFGVSREEWEASDMFLQKLEARLNCQEEREAAFQAYPGNCYAIYQLNRSEDAKERLYEAYDRLEAKGLSPDKSLYDLVYTGSIPEMGSMNKTLEGLFYQFNQERPADFAGHSLSMSDIVAVKRDGVVSCHYCDRVGFMELPNFLTDNPLKNAEMSVEDDCNMIDGIINNGEKPAAVAEQGSKQTSIYEQLRQPTPQQPTKSAPQKGAEMAI